jgi:tetratricopeptide (TPR) repeat protein
MGKWRLSRKWREKIERWKQAIVRAVTRPWIMVTGAFSWIGATAVAAWNSRHFKLLIQGFPALFAIIGVGALVANAQTLDRVSLAKDYLRAGFLAAKDQDYELAQSYLEKALKLEGHKDETKFMLAMVLAQAGKTDHCFAIMRALAPETANGYPRAHMWLGDYVDRHYTKNQETLRVIENHYQRAYMSAAALKSESGETVEAARRLGLLFVATNRFEDAVKYLEMAVNQFPYERMALAGAYQRLNRMADRDRTLQILMDHCRLKLKGNVNDKEARHHLALALVALEQFREAVDVVQAGIAHDRGDKALAQLLANVFAFWDIQIANKADTKIIDRFALVQQGLNAQPTHGYHLSRLVEFADLKGEDGANAKKIMEEMLLSGQSAPIIHFLLGGKAYQAGRIDEAKYHFEKAFSLDPNFAAVANNLAYVLSYQQNPDHERALQIINQAIEKVPGIPNMYGTRGQILSRMGRYKEALPDLERGLKANPNDVLLHQSLADTHKALGNVGMAEMHARRVEEINAAKPKKATELLTPTGEAFGPQPVTPEPAKPSDPPAPVEPPKSADPKSKGG